MEDDARELVHQINNLLAVALTQIEIARSALAPGSESAGSVREALDRIEQSAHDTDAVVRAFVARRRE